VKWDRNFLELRKSCYKATHDSRFAQANDELNEFLTNEPLTSDSSLLAKLLRHDGVNTASETEGMHRSRVSQK
jgi:hypothetical protein